MTLRDNNKMASKSNSSSIRYYVYYTLIASGTLEASLILDASHRATLPTRHVDAIDERCPVLLGDGPRVIEFYRA